MTHRNINNVLSVFVVILAVFIVLAPLLPQLDYIVNGVTVKAPSFVADSQNTTAATGTTEWVDSNQNQLYIPKIGALAPIIEGTAKNTVDKGLWHRPSASSPDKSGNTVIVGHRFSYNPGVVQPFYHLDKLAIGDQIYVQWNQKTYQYSVTEKKVVNANQVEVEAPTTTAQLTLYTCTPLWNPVQRLVIIAKPSGVSS